MFKNSVFRVNVNTVNWIKAAGIRAVKTMAQTAIGNIGAATRIGEVDWQYVGSAALLAGLVSILTSTVGIPEVIGAEGTEKEVDINE